jgi:hypothetical protein
VRLLQRPVTSCCLSELSLFFLRILRNRSIQSVIKLQSVWMLKLVAHTPILRTTFVKGLRRNLQYSTYVRNNDKIKIQKNKLT